MKLTLLSLTSVLLYCLFVWFRHTENIDVFISTDLPAGQRFYLASKLLALLALACLFLQIVFMVYSRYAPSKKFYWNIHAHLLLGLCTFVLIAAHSIAFAAAASFRGGSPAYALLLPNFHTGLYNAAVSLGLIAFYLSIVLVALGFFSRVKGVKYRRFHRYLVWLVLLCVLVHSVAIGSESKTWPMLLFYFAAILIIAWLLSRKRRHKTMRQ